jgi:hypothetical protein
MFVPMVKLVKYWWQYTSKSAKPVPKGFWLEFLTAQVFTSPSETYAESFTKVLENIKAKYSYYLFSNSGVPQLPDPVLPGHSLLTSMTHEDFRKFLTHVHNSHAKAVKALSLDNPLESADLWGEIFGSSFPISGSTNKAYTISEATSSLGLRDKDAYAEYVTKKYPAPETEDFIWKHGVVPSNHGYHLKIKCFEILSGSKFTEKGFRPQVTEDMLINKHVNLVFVARGNHNVPKPYEIRWKVRNADTEAQGALNGLRGEIYSDEGNEERSEPTQYKGKHYVECYIIKGKECVARDIFLVNIK